MPFNRRNFSRAEAFLSESPAAPSVSGKGNHRGADTGLSAINFAMEHFRITDSDLKKVLSVALEKGGNYADLFFEHTFVNSIGLQDGAVNRASSHIDFGMGVRVVAGDRTGYAYVENTTPEDMLRVARTAARIADGSGSPAPVDLTEIRVKNHLYRIGTAWEDVPVKNKMPYLQQMNDRIFEADKRVIKVSAWLNDSTSHVLFCNSEGQCYYDCRPMAVLGAQCVMAAGRRVESNGASRALRMGAEFLTDKPVEAVIKETVENTSVLFRSVKPKGGEMPVVMGAGGSGILLHEAIGHAFEADFNRKNISVFSDKLNRKVCHSHINIVDDGTIPFSRGAVNIDDEGIEGQKTYIVREGVLTGYLHDRISAGYYGVKPTGNGRRESFRAIPVPRMRATYMEAGRYDRDEIIASVKKGIYVSRFTNGQVQIGAGDFTFFVKNGYLIENGKPTQPIKDINIIGNGPEALADITMTGTDFEMDEGSWTCGKDGQSCPVALGMPSALVNKLTVGGEN